MSGLKQLPAQEKEPNTLAGKAPAEGHLSTKAIRDLKLVLTIRIIGCLQRKIALTAPRSKRYFCVKCLVSRDQLEYLTNAMVCVDCIMCFNQKFCLKLLVSKMRLNSAMGVKRKITRQKFSVRAYKAFKDSFASKFVKNHTQPNNKVGNKDSSKIKKPEPLSCIRTGTIECFKNLGKTQCDKTLKKSKPLKPLKLLSKNDLENTKNIKEKEEENKTKNKLLQKTEKPEKTVQNSKKQKISVFEKISRCFGGSTNAKYLNNLFKKNSFFQNKEKIDWHKAEPENSKHKKEPPSAVNYPKKAKTKNDEIKTKKFPKKFQKRKSVKKSPKKPNVKNRQKTHIQLDLPAEDKGGNKKRMKGSSTNRDRMESDEGKNKKNEERFDFDSLMIGYLGVDG